MTQAKLQNVGKSKPFCLGCLGLMLVLLVCVQRQPVIRMMNMPGLVCGIPR